MLVNALTGCIFTSVVPASVVDCTISATLYAVKVTPSSNLSGSTSLPSYLLMVRLPFLFVSIVEVIVPPSAIAGMAHRLRARAALNRPVRKRFAFFISVPLLLKKIIIGWAAGPPGLGDLHQHGVQCGALQRGNAAAPPALCREEKRRKNWAACPLGLRCI